LRVITNNTSSQVSRISRYTRAVFLEKCCHA
jgi:hypothetical protein